MDIFYIENFKVQNSLDTSNDLAIELRTICFIKITYKEFIATLGLDELYTTEVKLVSDVAPIYYDTVTKAFYKYFTSFKKDEFAKTAINMTLEYGHVLKKINWKPNFLSPKMLINSLMRKFVKDMMHYEFQELYN